MLINTATDLQGAPASPEHTTFLVNLLNDYITFDDAEYPEGYDRTIEEGDEGFVTPVLRQEWNAGAAAAWGFANRAAVEAAIEAALTPPTPEPEPPLEVEPEVTE